MADAVVTDADGREIEVRRMNKLEMRQFIRRMGPAADIDRWIGEAIIAGHAVTIGGVPVPSIRSPDDADAVVAQLDNVGIEAVAGWLKGTQLEPAALVAAAKN